MVASPKNFIRKKNYFALFESQLLRLFIPKLNIPKTSIIYECTYFVHTHYDLYKLKRNQKCDYCMFAFKLDSESLLEIPLQTKRFADDNLYNHIKLFTNLRHFIDKNKN